MVGVLPRGTVRCINAADNTPAALPRQGAASLFERIQVHSSGMVVEDSLHHNQLISLLSDMTNGDTQKRGVPAHLEGLGSDAGAADDIYEKGARFAARAGQATAET